MKEYRGYTIDRVFFNSKEEIDSFIRERAIKRLQNFTSLMLSYSDPGMKMAAIAEADRISEYLVSECGMTWEEVEGVEFA